MRLLLFIFAFCVFADNQAYDTLYMKSSVAGKSAIKFTEEDSLIWQIRKSVDSLNIIGTSGTPKISIKNNGVISISNGSITRQTNGHIWINKDTAYAPGELNIQGVKGDYSIWNRGPTSSNTTGFYLGTDSSWSYYIYRDSLRVRLGGLEKNYLASELALGASLFAPNARLESRDASSEQLRLAYDGSNFTTISSGGTGVLTINSSGNVVQVAAGDTLYSPTYSRFGTGAPAISTKIVKGIYDDMSGANVAHGLASRKRVVAASVYIDDAGGSGRLIGPNNESAGNSHYAYTISDTAVHVAGVSASALDGDSIFVFITYKP